MHMKLQYPVLVFRRSPLYNYICRMAVSTLATLIVGILTGNLVIAVSAAFATNLIIEATLSDGYVIDIITYEWYSSKTHSFMVNSSQGCQKEYSYFYNSIGEKIVPESLKTYWLYLMTGA